jgi:ribosome maturation factor RimP
MSLKQTLEEIVAKHLPEDDHFVVDIILSEKSNKSQVKILIDADQGVSIDTCAKVSRAVGDEIEAKELVPEAFVLEVSSPGLDYPLSSKRQYAKNVGRKLKVSLADGKDIEGQLTEVDNTEIKLLTKVKEKGKKAQEVAISIPLEQIKKSIVLVSFK